MVRIIETREAGSGDEYVCEFKVYLSPKDHSTAYGYLCPHSVIDHNQVTWVQTEFGVPVGDAFLTALGLCEKHGVSALWIHDPGGHFPADLRPGRDAGRL